MCCKAKKKQVVHDKRVSYLHTAPLKTLHAGAVNKPPQKLPLWFHYPGTFLLFRIDIPSMEEIGTINPENQLLRICGICFVPTLIHSLLEN